MSFIDFREVSIKNKLSKAKLIIIIGSGKGGVGKSTIASLISLKLSEMGKRTFLFDLDFTGSSIPLLLNTHYEVKESKKGFEPFKLGNLEIMSIKFFVANKPIALRGLSKEDVVKELLALTNWDADYVIIDLPPGINDELFTLTKLLKIAKACRKHLVVSNPSKVSVEVVNDYIKLLKSLNEPIAGLIINMSYIKCGSEIIKLGSTNLRESIKVIAELPLVPNLDKLLGNKKIPQELDTYVNELVHRILNESTCKHNLI